MKTVIEMAHETLERMNADEHCREQYWSATDDELQAFAEFVRADAIAAEREAIIDLVAFYGGPVDLEAAIRARSKNEDRN